MQESLKFNLTSYMKNKPKKNSVQEYSQEKTQKPKQILEQLTVKVPWYVELERKTKANKKISLNENIYRNTHFTVLNSAKKVFTEHMKDQLEGILLKEPVHMEIQLYKPSRRRLDLHNVTCVMSKFLCDSLTEYGVLSDDNDTVIVSETTKPIQLDKNKKGYGLYTFTYIGNLDK